jgi:hypothetical protein
MSDVKTGAKAGFKAKLNFIVSKCNLIIDFIEHQCYYNVTMQFYLIDTLPERGNEA